MGNDLNTWRIAFQLNFKRWIQMQETLGLAAIGHYDSLQPGIVIQPFTRNFNLWRHRKTQQEHVAMNVHIERKLQPRGFTFGQIQPLASQAACRGHENELAIGRVDLEARVSVADVFQSLKSNLKDRAFAWLEDVTLP